MGQAVLWHPPFGVFGEDVPEDNIWNSPRVDARDSGYIGRGLRDPPPLY
jgi:hypothetical protein